MICYTLFLFLPVWEMTGHGVWIESCMTAEGQLLIDRSSPHTRFQSLENGGMSLQEFNDKGEMQEVQDDAEAGSDDGSAADADTDTEYDDNDEF